LHHEDFAGRRDAILLTRAVSEKAVVNENHDVLPNAAGVVEDVSLQQGELIKGSRQSLSHGRRFDFHIARRGVLGEVLAETDTNHPSFRFLMGLLDFEWVAGIRRSNRMEPWVG
jgi:hypothetical protein